MTNNRKRRVVITGMGLLTPIGHTVKDTWQAILDGRSGFSRQATQFDMDGLQLGGICEVKDFDAAEYIGRKEARRRDRYQQFAAVTIEEAIQHSKLNLDNENRERIGVFVGTGVGGIQTTISQEWVRQESGPRRVSPFAITGIMPNGAAGIAAIDYGILGPSITTTTACAAGCDGVGMAFRYVRDGVVDVAITGGTEAPLVSMTVAGFERAGALSYRTEGTPSPFDKQREGLIPGEGAGMLVVESLEHALARNAEILGEIVGYAQTSDAYHITAPPEDGSGAGRAIRNALADADLQPEDVDYMNAHGTGTELNDAAETAAIKFALGEHAYNVGVSSTKSMTGHIMGATGAIESVFCALAIQQQIMPPTINLVEKDEACDLDYVSEGARSAEINVVTNHAFGFGGHNAVLVFRKYVP